MKCRYSYRSPVREITVSRRRALGGVAAIGGAAAGAGFGTLALFTDGESFTNNDLTAGTLDLEVAWRKTVVQQERRVETSDGFPEPRSAADAPVCRLEDVKPGDYGHVEFRLRVDDNPGYLRLLGAEDVDEENGRPEPERGALSESIPAGREGELDELLEATVSYPDAGTEAYTASLASLIGLGSVGTGIPLDGALSASVTDVLLRDVTPDAFAPGTDHRVRVDFEVPPTVGNGVQTDSYGFALGFYGEQARHNDP